MQMDTRTFTPLPQRSGACRYLKRYEIARLLDISPGYLSGILRGRYWPPPWTRLRICTLFRISEREFCRRWNHSARRNGHA